MTHAKRNTHLNKLLKYSIYPVRGISYCDLKKAITHNPNDYSVKTTSGVFLKKVTIKTKKGSAQLKNKRIELILEKEILSLTDFNGKNFDVIGRVTLAGYFSIPSKLIKYLLPIDITHLTICYNFSIEYKDIIIKSIVTSIDYHSLQGLGYKYILNFTSIPHLI